MLTQEKDYVVIPKTIWLKFQSRIKPEELNEEEKIEMGFISIDKLSSEQKAKLEEAKKLKDSEFVNL